MDMECAATQVATCLATQVQEPAETQVQEEDLRVSPGADDAPEPQSRQDCRMLTAEETTVQQVVHVVSHAHRAPASKGPPASKGRGAGPSPISIVLGSFMKGSKAGDKGIQAGVGSGGPPSADCRAYGHTNFASAGTPGLIYGISSSSYMFAAYK